ncbi:cytidylate kinase family protein [Desulfosudis oleivorans]|uniref:Response regulator receiver protein n=1 Tax=Desulfosudis oleivorans (strain DSM 6200 / JCM 39069 / Hxd3) TaxID=96561 RepID=A8ZZG0_DESOH|nr:cytidylate kinase family protein [Desulfosudis oleivorans]ABW67313.1 response regulator receiver protein [Desulfosudis oleivorans Hxd3]
MSVITISRGSYSRGKEVAEKVAEKLGYACISRDILLEASEAFNIPEIKLVRAIHDAPSVLERFTHGQERYISYIRKVLLHHVQKDNVVYHGLAGHFFLLNIPHVLKVRIIADMEDRVAEEMAREKIPEDKARYLLKKDDDERRKWGLQLYGIDTWDSQLYDMVLHIKTLTADDAVDLIVQTAGKPVLQTTARSQALVDDLALAATVQAELVKVAPRLEVTADNGVVRVGDMDGTLSVKQGVADEIRRIAGQVDGVKEVLLLAPEKPEGYGSVNPFHKL